MVTQLLTPAKKPTIADVSDTNSPAEARRKEKESRSVVSAKKTVCLPVKVVLISETLQTAVRY